MMISIFLPIKHVSRRVPKKNFFKIKTFKYGLTEIKLLQLKKLKNKLKFINIECEIIVSTDSDFIKKIIKKNNWITLHNRPKHLAKDDCLDDLIKEVPNQCNGKYILWTHVTSPHFNEKDYLNFIKIFLNNKKFKSAFSANLISTFIIDEKNTWISHNREKKKWPRTQDLKKFYSVNSAAFISERKNYIKLNDRLDNKPLPIISRKGSEFDIDEREDMDHFIKSLSK